ncbi:hypothetical protein U9M48_019197 [Paspalum notatum var. saurae]|uniref:Uncharacterized protein n=1 Tax=Paspalum notatum var. saurae TaxID=547442 RepID=A0AAQ3TEI7_PASNO
MAAGLLPGTRRRQHSPRHRSGGGAPPPGTQEAALLSPTRIGRRCSSLPGGECRGAAPPRPGDGAPRRCLSAVVLGSTCDRELRQGARRPCGSPLPGIPSDTASVRQHAPSREPWDTHNGDGDVYGASTK